jgi:hypothetical protein
MGRKVNTSAHNENTEGPRENSVRDSNEGMSFKNLMGASIISLISSTWWL